MAYVIEMNHITKKFPGIIANDDITLQLEAGEIHALLGENGAGKSTLMSVLFGMYKPEIGEILKNGEPVDIKSPNDANKYGIGMVHQHFMLVQNFTVLENIVLGAESVKGVALVMGDARKKVVALSEKYGLAIDPDAITEDVTVGMQQRVEILKMLYRDNEILIFDEPTAVLTPDEIDELMKIMVGLKEEGKSILFITHKLNEIKQVADRVTVLRKGKYIGTVAVADTTKEQMSKMMVGRDISFKVDKPESKVGEVVLSVDKLVVKGAHNKNAVENVTFDVCQGEIVTIAGIDGNGQSEFVYALTGLMPVDSGKITLSGEDITHARPRKRIMKGLSHIPEDRHKYGLVLDYNMAENSVIETYFLPAFQKNGFILRDKVEQHCETLIEKYDIRSSLGTKTTVRSMSGGNQQKAIVARELEKFHNLLIAVQPTRGLDVGAIEYIHSTIIEARNNGRAVLLVSFELDEVMNLSDRIIVFYEGHDVGHFNPEETKVAELGLYMAGTKRREA